MPRLQASVRTRAGVQGALRLARLLEMPERALASEIRELETEPLFARLRGLGVLSLGDDSGARFGARLMRGRELRSGASSIAELVDGNAEVVRLIEGLGPARFQRYFLADEPPAPERCAAECGLTAGQVRAIRALVDSAYARADLETPAPDAPGEERLSAVAGVQVEDGRPVLAFFNREIWKVRYRVDAERLRSLLMTASAAERRRVEGFLRRLELVDLRKSTLRRLLELALEAQAAYFIGRDPGLRRPLTQRSAARALGVDASVVNRLLARKCLELPWGLEAPLSFLFPSWKAILRDKLHDLALARPTLSDEGLRRALAAETGRTLSRRSIGQYRAELGLGARGRRS